VPASWKKPVSKSVGGRCLGVSLGLPAKHLGLLYADGDPWRRLRVLGTA
jgi:hypothetical protein